MRDSPDSLSTCSPLVPGASGVPKSLVCRVFEGPLASHDPKRSGNTVFCAEAPAQRTTANTNTTISFRMTTCYLDATRLLLVPGLFNCGHDGGAIRPRGTVYRHAVHALQIGRDTLENALCYPLAMLGLLQQLFIRWVAEERYLGEDGRHIRPDQHHKRCLAHAAVPDRPGCALNSFGKGVLNVFRQFFGLIDLLRARNSFHQIFQVVDALLRDRVFPGGDFHVLGRTP